MTDYIRKESLASEELAEAIYYMKVLQKCYSYMQPEMRKAIDVAVNILEEKES